jgi:hypothetical protein
MPTAKAWLESLQASKLISFAQKASQWVRMEKQELMAIGGWLMNGSIFTLAPVGSHRTSNSTTCCVSKKALHFAEVSTAKPPNGD